MRVDALENERPALMQEMAAAGEDYVALQRMAARVEEIERELVTAEERWLELSEIAELSA